METGISRKWPKKVQRDKCLREEQTMYGTPRKTLTKWAWKGKDIGYGIEGSRVRKLWAYRMCAWELPRFPVSEIPSDSSTRGGSH